MQREAQPRVRVTACLTYKLCAPHDHMRTGPETQIHARRTLEWKQERQTPQTVQIQKQTKTNKAKCSKSQGL